MKVCRWFGLGVPVQVAMTCTCLAAFLLFGYDKGVFGVTVSIYNIGCLVGRIINFFIGERLSRRRAILLAMILTAIGAIIQCASFNVRLSYRRAGIDTSTVPMYQAELCKSQCRGRLVTTEVLFTGLGITIAYFFVFGFSFTSGALSWRLPIAGQIIPFLAISVIVLGVPESPRWLRTAMLQAVATEEENPFRWMQILKPDAVKTAHRLGLSCLVLLMNHWTDNTIIVFYAPRILEQNVGLEHTIALAVAGHVQFAFVVGSLVPASGLYRFGRRKPMIVGAFGMATSMMMVSILLSFKGTDKEGPTSRASIALLIPFMIFFRVSLNAIPWCYSAEILPLDVRAEGTARLAWKTYVIFMAMNFAFIPAIYFLFPETRGLTPEQIDFLFIDRDQVHGLEGVGTVSREGEKGPASEYIE
ncbi:hypothetical protein BDV06DRAFT_214311 [Aspergillus oleicola]